MSTDTKTSLGPWADEPFQLLPIASRTHDIKSHSAVFCASEMAHAHNCMLRGMNSIYQQAPYVSQEKDVADLLYYVVALVKGIEHHHHMEETVLFPKIEEFAGKPDLFDGSQHQHDSFTPGLHKLLAYAETTKPQDFKWNDMKAIIDDFAPSFMQHLNDEVALFLSLTYLDSKGLRKNWDLGEDAAKAKGNLQMMYDIFPLGLGCADKTYDGGNDFPPLPALMTYAIKYWFCRAHAGSWRFNPCDLWGQPRPLLFVPKE